MVISSYIEQLQIHH